MKAPASHVWAKKVYKKLSFLTGKHDKKKDISVYIWRNLFKEIRVTMFLCCAFY